MKKRAMVTKRMGFCYGHYLPEYQGACARQHGHNAEVEVTVDGINLPLDKIYDGMVCDFSDLKSMMRVVIDTLDHRNLNEHAEWLANPENSMIDDDGVRWIGGICLCAHLWEYMPPTAENMARYIFDWFDRSNLFKDRIIRVRVSETPDSWATVERNPMVEMTRRFQEEIAEIMSRTAANALMGLKKEMEGAKKGEDES